MKCLSVFLLLACASHALSRLLFIYFDSPVPLSPTCSCAPQIQLLYYTALQEGTSRDLSCGVPDVSSVRKNAEFISGWNIKETLQINLEPA